MSEAIQLLEAQKSEFPIDDNRLSVIGKEALEKGKYRLRSVATRITGKTASSGCEIQYEAAIDEAYDQAFTRTKSPEKAIRSAFYNRSVEIVFYTEDIQQAIRASIDNLPNREDYIRLYSSNK